VPKDDAITCLNDIGKVLAYLYTVDDLTSKSIVTGYNAFPDIAKGTSFWMDAYFSFEAAMRGYINAPSEDQFNKMLQLTGAWHVEWKGNSDLNETCILRFVHEGEYLKATIEVDSKRKVYDDIMIRLFGNYFHLIIKGMQGDGSPEITMLKFELEIFNDTILLGKILGEERKAYFIKIGP
jgi:hypothetical protein